MGAESLGALGDEVGLFDRRAVERDLVRAGQQDGADILDCAQATANGKGDKDRLGLLFGLIAFFSGFKCSDDFKIDTFYQDMLSDRILIRVKQNFTNPGSDYRNFPFFY